MRSYMYRLLLMVHEKLYNKHYQEREQERKLTKVRPMIQVHPHTWHGNQSLRPCLLVPRHWKLGRNPNA